MAENLRILVVEDERILAETIIGMVEDLGHHVVASASSIAKAEECIYRGGFDLAILDINLKHGDEGIKLGKILYEKQIPFFFLTSYSDKRTLSLAKAVRPGSYVVKPFTEKDLYVAIEMTAENIDDEQSSVVVRKGNTHVRINTDDIEFLKAENIYTEIHTREKVWLKRSSLKDLIDEMEEMRFVQTHRSFAVNIEKVTGWSSHTIHINEKEIPVSRRLWDDIKITLESKFS
ncbi:LytR/AlgR family response regulator transcription factor [Phaeocystidibacter luteus]|uniref:Response regulator transcription factor n=1 Tax=Phaeocystidibacter luteus TaxID=911197 RepID=A0A6N6RMU8_9FLAO|nr:response regulator transcription factor [Phaeocystidibacter luteus]KAB2814872.1 response regulator transcription factor [Phaeocystidibacter luteus]